MESSQNQIISENAVPLCVDLDGTLIRSDLLLESVFALLKKNFLYLFLLPFWLLKGKANLKHQIAMRAEVCIELLPYNEVLLEFLQQEKEKGSELVLATASNEKYAQQIANYLGIFDRVIASSSEHNLSGSKKRDQLLDSYGESGFDYIGNALVDIKIWRHAHHVIVVNPERGVLPSVKTFAPDATVFDEPISLFGVFLKAMRMHQWLKNVLIFVPLVMAHQLGEMAQLWLAMVGFVVFGLCASSVYLLNDLLDLPADRRHPTKKDRPIASGSMPIKLAAEVAVVLLVAAFLLAWLLLPYEFFVVLFAYYAITIAYSFKLKDSAIVDAIVLAALYTIRIIAGAAAILVEPSFWLLAFSMFFFYGLALVKRYSEVSQIEPHEKARGYHGSDVELLSQSGIASGFMAVLVLALYINNEHVYELYNYPQVLWLLCPLVLYWMNRVWLLTRRGQMHDDPVMFAIKDHHSHFLVVLGLVVLWVAA